MQIMCTRSRYLFLTSHDSDCVLILLIRPRESVVHTEFFLQLREQGLELIGREVNSIVGSNWIGILYCGKYKESVPFERWIPFCRSRSDDSQPWRVFRCRNSQVPFRVPSTTVSLLLSVHLLSLLSSLCG